MTEHLTSGRIRDFLRGQLSKDEVSEVVSHLLGRCETCSALLASRSSHREVETRPPASYDQAFDRALAAVVERESPVTRERLAAPALAARLAKLPSEQQRLLIRNDPRYQTWGLCENLIRASQQAIWDVQPESLLEQATCAVWVGESIDVERYGQEHVNDLLAEARGNLANAYRVRSQFTASLAEFRKAHALLDQGTGDETLRARLASLESSLLVDRGHFEEAVELLDGACKRIARLDETQLEARLLVSKGVALSYFAPAQAIEAQREALPLIDASESPRLMLCAKQGVICSLNAIGRSEEALVRLHQTRSLFDQFSDPWSQLNYRWTEARITFDLGQVAEAEVAFRGLWQEALDLGLHLETALIVLDLMEVEISLGHYQQAAAIGSRLAEQFEAWGVHRRAMQAWQLLAEAARQETATRAMVGQLTRYLRRAWQNPEIEFAG